MHVSQHVGRRVMSWVVVMVCGAGAACRGSPASPGVSPPPPPPSSPAPVPSPPATYDVDARGVPRFAGSDYIDLAPIALVSKFRSAVGHDYHDDVESCRSMKHYFQPRSTADWGAVGIYSPVAGTIAVVRPDSGGQQLVIRSTAMPAFTFILFHVVPGVSVDVGSVITAGQRVGHHVGSQTYSDIAVGVDTPAGYRLVSWLEVMTDDVFQAYVARGLTTRAGGIISRVDRDRDPLGCVGETFSTSGTIGNWVALN